MVARYLSKFATKNRFMTRAALILLSLFAFVGVSAQDAVKDQVVDALKTGDASTLASHFIANIDLTVKSTADVYSKAQAEQVLRKFFNENPPVDLVIEHSGVSKSGDKYFIGILRTRAAYFRTTFFLKRTGDVFQVKALRIEDSKNDF